MKKSYKVKGMDCTACAKMIELDLEDIGVKASCNYLKETLEVEGEFDEEKIKQTLKTSGYTII
ncbi:hypothetical protein A3A76_01410 [Candidatus Woesebacteria bacterium RIFCSPLOWO2_01_FULL_39_23]|uniref:HMA domain-containing protein n=1 Tax=Candidatus Woesebacteria bacterium RIFCSPHIGHO2_01_FULL_40_22 TaxID=1802499 RepID=A0A1F7YGU7_9BACT|nr:MAG: hypothetical protein A2141_04960 [Candidatus Woesebacteria bacterium RBG_16_40_11]OGM26482.1 MAG: hypothetical protein A2628_03005 [Candidatus Woesebacteria bacterium RIFCSPHIGHO2_01_FULL_40_22]OGM37651.1 MAG: hypothetical protein A3E41_05525 [Candidatus Woesebacteria bacterium RIFCSPHIGHO2_12_FULL_38_9]OGM62935.1 MAG: hypothetical protein A3A76_01410 [Candidatus Woesebacteria bacterium RIFCSPLOWO2_01_FULL_39_23]